MSAFVVDKAHIDALVTAGLVLPGTYGPLAWQAAPLTDEDRAGAFERGEPWGPLAIRLYRERRRELTRETAGTVGAMLAAENVRSVNHRYDEQEWEEPYDFARLPGSPDPVLILKALSCYEYQSCEHPEWEQSEARAFCDALTAACIRRLPGYDDAPGWEIHDRNAFAWRSTARSAQAR